MDVRAYVEHLSAVSAAGVFNPYSDSCSEHDNVNAPAIRRTNFECYLKAAIERGVDSIWLGRDCGYRGGRRTGIALTDEFQLTVLRQSYGLSRLAKATVSAPVKERTATEVWRIVREVKENIFLWNVFPFHPHEMQSPLSNRRHSAKEFDACKSLLVDLIRALRPQRIVSLGLDAFREVTQLGFSAIAVRHPSYGGHKEFAASMRELYRLPVLF